MSKEKNEKKSSLGVALGGGGARGAAHIGVLQEIKEDRYCLVDADNIAAVSGISFAEWGPGDMGMSFGHLDQHDPPYSDEMNDAREIVKNAIDKSGLAFLCGWKDSSMNEEQQTRFCLDELGARVLHVSDSNLANEIRIEMGREMPW